jgi:integrase
MDRKLTALHVKHAMRERKPGFLGDGGGLYLKNGTSWVSRGCAHGARKSRDMGLGAAVDVTLAEAGERAAAARKLRRQGVDPIAARRATRAQDVTFRDEAEAYVKANAPGWRSDKHREQWTSSLANYVYPVIGDMNVAAIGGADILRVLTPIWATKAPTASRLRSRLELILDAAKAKGHRDGPNPAAWKGNLAAILPPPKKITSVVHFAAMPYAEVAAFMVHLRARPGTPELALEYLILTAARTSEVLQATWDEIDLGAKLWTIPAERTKALREHRVPLSDPAVAVIKKMESIRQSDFVFPGQRRGRPQSADILQFALRRLGRPDVTPHGFRSSFRTWVSESTSFPSEVAEMALGHQVGSAVERAYARSDQMEKRRRLADAWAAYCAGEGGRRVVALAR